MENMVKLADKEFKAAIINVFRYKGKQEHHEGTNGSSVKKWKCVKELNENSRSRSAKLRIIERI